MARTFDVAEEVHSTLGAEVWRARVDGEAAKRAPRPRYNILYLFFVLSFTTVSGSLGLFAYLVAGRVEGLAGIVVAGVASALLLWGTKRRVRMPVLAVHERGILVPRTVTSNPGMQKVGGPAVILASDIAGATRVEDGDNLAVLVRTRTGATGLVDHAKGEGGFTPEAWRATVDQFCKALEGLGVPVKHGGLDDVAPEGEEE